MARMRGCFVDQAGIPKTCCVFDGDPSGCPLSAEGMHPDDCEHWQPRRAYDLAMSILAAEGAVSAVIEVGEEPGAFTVRPPMTWQSDALMDACKPGELVLVVY